MAARRTNTVIQQSAQNLLDQVLEWKVCSANLVCIDQLCREGIDFCIQIHDSHYNCVQGTTEQSFLFLRVYACKIPVYPYHK